MNKTLKTVAIFAAGAVAGPASVVATVLYVKPIRNAVQTAVAKKLSQVIVDGLEDVRTHPSRYQDLLTRTRNITNYAGKTGK